MKKVFAIFLCLALVVGMTACGSTNNAHEAKPTEATPKATAEKPTETVSAEETTKPTYKPQKIVLSYFGAESSPSGLGVTRFKELVEERSGGAITVETYFNGTLYNQSTEYEALMKGDVDLIITSLNYAMEYITELKTTFCPYMWVSLKHVQDFWFKNETGVALMKRMEDELGVRQLSWHEGGYRNTCLNKDLKINSTKVLKGIKLRSSPAENMITMTAALGGNPIPIAFSECYMGMQTGVVDGFEANLTSVISNSLDEVTKSVTLTEHYLALDGFAVSFNNFKTWAPEVQQLITECAQEASDHISEISKKTDADAVESLRNKGIVIYDLTDEERAAYREEVLDAFMSSDFAADYDQELFNAIKEMGKNY